jgi:hypothetical protein
VHALVQGRWHVHGVHIHVHVQDMYRRGECAWLHAHFFISRSKMVRFFSQRWVAYTLTHAVKSKCRSCAETKPPSRSTWARLGLA